MRQKYDHLPMRDVGFKRACILTSSVGSIPVHVPAARLTCTRWHLVVLFGLTGYLAGDGRGCSLARSGIDCDGESRK